MMWKWVDNTRTWQNPSQTRMTGPNRSHPGEPISFDGGFEWRF
ncbi:hypothetical protein [Verrucomicrobium spinosum]|nr:hypothetical protein [Verrucomicrobium spinosum]